MRHLNRLARPLIAMLITGGVMTSSATFAADKGDKPAAVQTVKDGLSVCVAPAREVFAADENPTFAVTFTNLRDSALRLCPGITMVDAWTITAEDVATGATYRVSSIVEYRRRVLAITTLAAKESKMRATGFQQIPVHTDSRRKERRYDFEPASGKISDDDRDEIRRRLRHSRIGQAPRMARGSEDRCRAV